MKSNKGTRGARRASGAFRKVALLAAAVTVIGLVNAPAAFASSVTSAVFTGGAGTVTVGGTLYAKQGAALTLTVVTSSDTKCVDVTGAATLPRQTSSHGEVQLDVHDDGARRQRRAGLHRRRVAELQRQQLHRPDQLDAGVVHPGQHRPGRDRGADPGGQRRRLEQHATSP